MTHPALPPIPQFDAYGNPITREQLMRMAQEAAETDLPQTTDETRALAGTRDNPGRWYKLAYLYGPKTLPGYNTETLAVEMYDDDNVRYIIYCSGLIEAKLMTMKPFLAQGIPMYFRYVWNPNDPSDKGKRGDGFYTSEIKVQEEWPS